LIEDPWRKPVFKRKSYLEDCFSLPAREPAQYWKPERTKPVPYFADSVVLGRNEKEVAELQQEGVPIYLARAMVLNKYCDNFETLKKRVEKQKQELRP
jgi:hypothetical protein